MPGTDLPPQSPEPGSPTPSDLSDQQLARLATLVADDRCPFPDDLTPGDRTQLLDALRPLLRHRLVQLVARALAQQRHRGAGPPDGEP